MLKKPDLGPHANLVFAEPTPLGLIGLAIGCAALVPAAFGQSLTPGGFKTAAVFCLVFGGGCQFLAGMMNFANKNLWGGTILTAFSFNWLLNWWAFDSLASGFLPDHNVILAVDVVFLIIFLALTYGFGFFSKLLFLFLLDIDLLYAARIGRAVTGTKLLDYPIAAFTVALAAIALWIAFATMLNPTVGRALLKIPGPIFFAPSKPSFDFSLRQAIFDALYAHFRLNAFEPMPLADLEKRVAEKAQGKALAPDLFYLSERGGLNLTLAGGKIESVRLTAEGIDQYEQQALRKHAA
ncbi:MAG: hypothetical protein HY901_17995 [Deltaproteobacteria bacterium]|nr:hypothetical protein [Deltaproteobacteria bacterium]